MCAPPVDSCTRKLVCGWSLWAWGCQPQEAALFSLGLSAVRLRVGTHFWHWAWEPLTQRMCPTGAFASCTWGGASEKGGCCDLCLREEETQLIQPCLPSGLCGTAWSGLPSSSRPVAWRWAWISHLGALLAGMCGRTVCAGYAKLAVCLRCFSLGHPYAVKLFTKHLWWNMPEKPVFCKCRWPEDSCYSWVCT